MSGCRTRAARIRCNFPSRSTTSLSVVTRGEGQPIGNAAPILKNLTAELKVQTNRLAKVLATDIWRVRRRRTGWGCRWCSDELRTQNSRTQATNSEPKLLSQFTVTWYSSTITPARQDESAGRRPRRVRHSVLLAIAQPGRRTASPCAVKSNTGRQTRSPSARSAPCTAWSTRDSSRP